MSYLQRTHPTLFERYSTVRHLDARLCEVFEDLETSARLFEGGGQIDNELAAILSELTSELRSRVAKCENDKRQNME